MKNGALGLCFHYSNLTSVCQMPEGFAYLPTQLLYLQHCLVDVGLGSSGFSYKSE